MNRQHCGFSGKNKRVLWRRREEEREEGEEEEDLEEQTFLYPDSTIYNSMENKQNVNP